MEIEIVSKGGKITRAQTNWQMFYFIYLFIYLFYASRHLVASGKKLKIVEHNEMWCGPGSGEVEQPD